MNGPDTVRDAHDHRVNELLVAAARHGLVAEVSTSLVLDEVDAEAVRRWARRDHMSSMLSVAIDGGVMVTDDDTAAAVASDWHADLSLAVVLEASLVRVAAVLDRAAVDWRLTKGPALAHLDYEDPALRCFGDIDVIVHPAHWSSARQALEAAGMQRAVPELAPGYDAHFGKGATFVDSNGRELDLHRRLAIGRFGVRCDMIDLFSSADHIVLAGRTVPCLDGPGRLLHACYHMVLGGSSGLRARRDVAQLILVRDIDWTATVGIANRWHAAAVVARAVMGTWDALRLDADHPAARWAQSHPVGRADAWTLSIFERERPFRSQALTALPTMSPVRWPRYVSTLAMARVRKRRR